MNRFWSSFWTVAGCLFLLTLVQGLADRVVTLFRLVHYVLPAAEGGLLALSRAVVPIWAALTFIDWRWGWKPDNAGLRNTPAAGFWLLPGLAGGLAVAAVSFLLSGFGRLPQPDLSVETAIWSAVGAVGAFATELVFRGVVISRFEQDLSGRDLLIQALVTPLAWAVAGALLLPMLGIDPYPSPEIWGLGTAALSVLLSLLFLQTQSVWLVGGVRVGLGLGASLLGLTYGDTALLLVAGVPAAVLLWMELDRMRRIHRPGPRGPRGGRKRVVYGKTVRGPWGPH